LTSIASSALASMTGAQEAEANTDELLATCSAISNN
jgi:hypothetical protein